MSIGYAGYRLPVALSVDLPFPPSQNSLYRTLPNRGRALTKRAREFRADCLPALTSAPKVRWGNSHLAVEMWLYPPDKRKRDVDNAIKASLDALVYHGVIPDDSRVERLTIERREIVKKGRLTVRVAPISKSLLP